MSERNTLDLDIPLDDEEAWEIVMVPKLVAALSPVLVPTIIGYDITEQAKLHARVVHACAAAWRAWRNSEDK